MKYFMDFLTELKQGIVYPVYLFYGPESYLIEQALLNLKKHLLPPGAEQFNYRVLDGEKIKAEDLAAAACSTSLIPGLQLVTVRQPKFFEAAPKKGSKETASPDDSADGSNQSRARQRLGADEQFMLDYLTAPPEGICLILIAGSSLDRRKKIYKEVLRAGKVVEFSQLRPTDLKKWLMKRVKEENCSFDPAAVELLLQRCGRDMFTLYYETDKLIRFVGAGGAISPAVVQELVAARVEENIFQVVDAIGLQDAGGALAGISNLLRQKHPPQLILGMVARQFRLLLQIKSLKESGHDGEQIRSVLKLHAFVYRKLSRQCPNFTLSQLVRSIHDLAELDHGVKSGTVAFYPALELLILKICVKI